jgi:DNA-binding phage protein
VPRVVVPVKEEILRAAERRKAAEGSEGIAQFLAELIDLGFEHRLQQLYRRFEEGEISLGFLAQELGLGVRDLYEALERRGLPTTNIGARQPTTGE